MSESSQQKGVDVPEYVREGGPLPKGGPDRARLCFWYSQKYDGDHFAALRHARGCLLLFYMYLRGGLIDNLSEVEGGVPKEFYGENDSPSGQ